MIVARRRADIQTGELKRVVFHMCRHRGDKEPEDAVEKWENRFAHYLEVKHAVAVSSGRLGMEIILKALALDAGSEVIIPAYTLKDLVPLIQGLDLKPVPADIDSETFNMDPNSVKNRITNNTKAILPTHLFGNPCPMKKIMELAKAHSLFVIEDCAHSAGSEISRKKTGTFGHAAFFSFETIKPINTYGGGMIATNDDNIAKFARRELYREEYEDVAILSKVLTAYIERLLFSTSLSFPFLYLLASPRWKKAMNSLYRGVQRPPKKQKRYSQIQANLGLEKIQTLEKRTGERRKKAEYLKSLLNDTVQVQSILPDAITNYYFFVALLPGDTVQIRKNLLSHGFDAGIGHEIADDCSALLGYDDCPNVKGAYKRAIHLPLYETMSDSQLERLTELIRRRT